MEDNGREGYIKRNVIGLGITSLLTDISSESVYAVLPFYIRSLGLGREVVGLVEGIGELSSSIFKFLSGYIAQKIGRYKGLALLGYAMSNMVKPFFVLSKTGLEIAVVKAIDRIGKGVRTSPRDALLAASSRTTHRGRAFGLHRALDTIGATIGPLLAIILLVHYGYVGVFLFSIVPGLLALTVLALYVKEVETTPSRVNSIVHGFPTIYWLFIATVALSGLAGYTQAFLLLRAKELGWSEGFSIGFLVMANTLYALLAYPVGVYSDVLRRGQLYPFIYVIQIMGVSTILVINQLYGAIIFFLVYGVYMAFHDTLTRIMTSRYVKEYLRGIGYGIMHSIYGVSALLGYYVLGWLYEVGGYRIAFTYSLIVGVIGLIFSLILVSKTRG